MHNRFKTQCPRGHALSGENLAPTSVRRGQRYCRTCNRASARLSVARRKGRKLTRAGAIRSVLADPKYLDSSVDAVGREYVEALHAALYEPTPAEIAAQVDADTTRSVEDALRVTGIDGALAGPPRSAYI